MSDAITAMTHIDDVKALRSPARKALAALGVYTVGDLANVTDRRLLQQRNISRKSLGAIVMIAESVGISIAHEEPPLASPKAAAIKWSKYIAIVRELAASDPIVRYDTSVGDVARECGCCHRTFDSEEEARDPSEHMVSCAWARATTIAGGAG